MFFYEYPFVCAPLYKHPISTLRLSICFGDCTVCIFKKLTRYTTFVVLVGLITYFVSIERKRSGNREVTENKNATELCRAVYIGRMYFRPVHRSCTPH